MLKSVYITILEKLAQYLFYIFFNDTFQTKVVMCKYNIWL